MVMLEDLLKGNSYPGRVLITTVVGDGTELLVYAVTGRSQSSRDRQMVLTENQLFVEPLVKEVDDVLRHYVAAVETADSLVVGNGRQVDDVAQRVAEGRSTDDLYSDVTYEPDPPIFTPRITAYVNRKMLDEVVLLSAMRDGISGQSVTRVMKESLQQGQATMLSTYEMLQDSVSASAPISRGAHDCNDAEAMLQMVWSGLAEERRVAVAVIPLRTGLQHALIKNHV